MRLRDTANPAITYCIKAVVLVRQIIFLLLTPVSKLKNLNMIQTVKYVCVCWVFRAMMSASFAQTSDTLHYTDAQQLTLIGKPFENGPFYHRLDTAAFPAMPQSVKRLLTHSAGLAISFGTNSTKIAAKWCTSPRKPGNNMTAIAFEGLDLYIKRDGRWQYAGVARPATNECNEYTLVQDMEPGDKECLLYLPLYDETTSLEIGIEADADNSARPTPFEKNT